MKFHVKIPAGPQETFLQEIQEVPMCIYYSADCFCTTFSTIGLGIVIILIGFRLADRYEALAEVATPLILLGISSFFIS